MCSQWNQFSQVGHPAHCARRCSSTLPPCGGIGREAQNWSTMNADSFVQHVSMVTTLVAAASGVAPEGWWSAGGDKGAQNGGVSTSARLQRRQRPAMGAGRRWRPRAQSGPQRRWLRLHGWRRGCGGRPGKMTAPRMGVSARRRGYSGIGGGDGSWPAPATTRAIQAAAVVAAAASVASEWWLPGAVDGAYD